VDGERDPSMRRFRETYFALDETSLIIVIVFAVDTNQFQAAQGDQTGMKVLVEQFGIVVTKFFASDEFVRFSWQIKFRMQGHVADRFVENGVYAQR
jgi:hypothetical protein